TLLDALHFISVGTIDTLPRQSVPSRGELSDRLNGIILYLAGKYNMPDLEKEAKELRDSWQSPEGVNWSKIFETNLSDVVSDIFNRDPSKIDSKSIKYLVAVVMFAADLFVEPFSNMMKFGPQMGIQMLEYQLKVIQNILNYSVYGTIMTAKTDQAGAYMLDDNGCIQFETVGKDELIQSIIQMIMFGFMFETMSPYMMIKNFNLLDDYSKGRYFQMLVKCWAINYMVMSSRGDFWNSGWGKMLKTIGCAHPAQFIEYMMRSRGYIRATKFAENGFLSYFPSDKLEALTENDYVRLFWNLYGTGMEKIQASVDAKKKEGMRKSICKILLRVLRWSNQTSQAWNVNNVRRKALRKVRQDLIKFLKSQSLGVDDPKVHHRKPGTWNSPAFIPRKEKELRAKVPSPEQLTININGEWRSVAVKGIRIGTVGKKYEDAKSLIEVELNLPGPRAVVSDDNVSVTLVVNEGWLRSLPPEMVSSGQWLDTVEIEIKQIQNQAEQKAFPTPGSSVREKHILTDHQITNQLKMNAITIDNLDIVGLTDDSMPRLIKYCKDQGITKITDENYRRFALTALSPRRDEALGLDKVYEHVIWPMFHIGEGGACSQISSSFGKDDLLAGKWFSFSNDKATLMPAGFAALKERIATAIKTGKIIVPGVDSIQPLEALQNSKAVNELAMGMKGDLEKYMIGFNNATEIHKARGVINLDIPEKGLSFDEFKERHKSNSLLNGWITGSSGWIKNETNWRNFMELSILIEEVDAGKLASRKICDEGVVPNASELPLSNPQKKKHMARIKELSKTLQIPEKFYMIGAEKGVATNTRVGQIALLMALVNGKPLNFSQLMFQNYDNLMETSRHIWYNLGTGEGKSLTSFLLTLDLLKRGEKVVLTFTDPDLLKKGLAEISPLLLVMGKSVEIFKGDGSVNAKRAKNQMDHVEVLLCLASDLDAACAADKQRKIKVMESLNKRTAIQDESDQT
ncbi:MAG: hypothetical protein AABZ14_03785, partial [Candidatus Margulisiibacteriota bacterium]